MERDEETQRTRGSDVRSMGRRPNSLVPFPSILLLVILVASSLLVSPAECRRKGGYIPGGHHGIRRGHGGGGALPSIDEFKYQGAPNCRSHTASLADFGGVPDGVTSNTRAFQAAIDHLSQFARDGGGLLYVPSGRWLTGSFNLTSCFTLYLHRDAVILGSQDMNEWPLTDPLPSYGRGRDAPGGRYSSLIRGINLTDVVITGDNGTIDGQGQSWWLKYRAKQLTYTRGYLVELMYSDQILISNLTFVNSPSWNIHPIYSTNVIVSGVTVLAPIDSPNTDGINPDSCSNVLIQDCYVVSGDDCVAIKSGWDQYGIAFGMPSQHIVVKRLTCVSPTSAVIALGSEMSGGISDVRAEDITAVNSESGVRIKTAIGRGAYVKDVFVKGMSLHTMKWVFWMTGNYGSHPDDGWDRNAVPVINGINYRDIFAENVTMAGQLEGLQVKPFTGICISNATIGYVKSKKPAWTCSQIQGVSSYVTPQPCDALQYQRASQDAVEECPFPEDRLPIEEVEIQECSYSR